MNTQSNNENLHTEDDRLLSQIVAVKRHVYSFIDQKKLAEFFVSLVDNSGLIRFEIPSDRRFVSVRNLSVALVMDTTSAAAIDPEVLSEHRPVATNARTTIIREKIVAPFIEMMTNILKEILHGLDEEYVHREWMEKILPVERESLVGSINNFLFDTTAEDREEIAKEAGFLLGMCSALVFPPLDTDLNEDGGFTLEIMI